MGSYPDMSQTVLPFQPGSCARVLAPSADNSAGFEAEHNGYNNHHLGGFTFSTIDVPTDFVLSTNERRSCDS